MVANDVTVKVPVTPLQQIRYIERPLLFSLSRGVLSKIISVERRLRVIMNLLHI